MKDYIKEIEDNKILLEIHNSIYSDQSLLLAAYNLSDKAYILINRTSANITEIIFTGIDIGKDELIKCARQYCSDIIDQQIRLDIEKKFGNIRDIIVQQAFSQIK